MRKLIKHLQSKPLIQVSHLKKAIIISLAVVCSIISILLISYLFFEYTYRDKIYPNVFVNGVWFGGKTTADIQTYWDSKNEPYENAFIEFRAPNMIATASGMELALGYDASLSATQAFLIGRSGNFISDIKTKLFTKYIDIKPLFRYNTGIIEGIFNSFSQSIDIPAQDSLFNFKDGKVVEFKPSALGKKVDLESSQTLFMEAVRNLPNNPTGTISIDIPIVTVEPIIATDKANTYGIKERIGTGYSEFSGSIPGRIHNVALAASRFNGVLIPPNTEFSFNKVLGDVSAATGYQQAYIIKEGRTILGDGGGVCQVSTTLFRAAMDAGLPIIERHAHAYRVHYYEEGGFKAGMDATVFDPSADLKIKNDTPSYILIQTRTDTDNLNMSFDIYGASDGRKSEISDQIVYGITPPPPDNYQDDPTLPKGVVRQVDFAAWGAKASFKYKVTRNSETLIDTKFDSNYRPWQAIFLRGTKE